MNDSSGCFACCAHCGSLSRSGPVVAEVPAAVSLWHAPHWLFLKTASPEVDVFWDVVACDWPCNHLSNALWVMTIAYVRITAWPSPHSSVQMTGKRPVRSGVMCSVGWMPGTVSCFWPHSGTQKEWMTSFDVKVSS